MEAEHAAILTRENVTEWKIHPAHISANDGWLYRILDVYRDRLWGRYTRLELVPMPSFLLNSCFFEGSRLRLVMRARSVQAFVPMTCDVVSVLPSGIAVKPVRRLLKPTFSYALMSDVTPFSA